MAFLLVRLLWIFLVPGFCGQDALQRAPATKIEALIAALPEYAHFGLSRPTYWNGRLYAASNLGLLEFEGDHLVGLWRSSEKDSVIEGPWLDSEGRSLWIMSFSPESFHRRDIDGDKWISVAIPRPSKGDYTRGEWLEGFTPMWGTKSFSLVAAGAVWRWDAKENKFRERELAVGRSVAAAATATAEVFAQRKDMLALGEDPMESDVIRFVQNGSAKEPTPKLGKYNRYSKFYVEQMVPDREGVWIRTKEGDLLWADRNELRVEPTPGDCEYLTKSSKGVVLASFAKQGIFEHSDAWKKVLDHPCPADPKNYWCYFAELDGQFAFVATAKPIMENGRSSDLSQIKWTHPGPNGLWISTNGKWKPLFLGKKWEPGVIKQ